MITIINRGELLRADDARTAEARRLALDIIEHGLRAADPRAAVRRALKVDGDILRVGGVSINLKDYDRILVIGAGKASAAMAEAVEEILGDLIDEGLVIAPRGVSACLRRVKLLRGDHPIPSEDNVKAAAQLAELVDDAGERTLILALISGGGSALLCLPMDGVGLEDLRELTKLLLASGATIDEVNAVRKHLEQLKGGRLAARAWPARVVSLIISDVVGDRIDVIASGPTAPDPTTYEDAIRILKVRGLWERAPASVRQALERGAAGIIPETPKPGDPIFDRVSNVIIASNRISVEAMERRARELGLRAAVLSTTLEGEAREVGRVLAAIARELADHDRPLARPCALLAGGEPTVTLERYGELGGRNQELALAFAIAVSGIKGVALAAVGSDGIDGNSDAAGAIVDGYTVTLGRASGLDAEEALRRHASYRFLKAAGHLVFTGPTGTNVNDLIALVAV